MIFGMAAYAIVRDSEAEAQSEVARITTLDPERAGLRQLRPVALRHPARARAEDRRNTPSPTAACARTSSARPDQIRERIAAYEAAGLDLLLLQMSPQLEEMERFAAEVIGHPAAMAA